MGPPARVAPTEGARVVPAVVGVLLVGLGGGPEGAALVEAVPPTIAGPVAPFGVNRAAPVTARGREGQAAWAPPEEAVGPVGAEALGPPALTVVTRAGPGEAPAKVAEAGEAPSAPVGVIRARGLREARRSDTAQARGRPVGRVGPPLCGAPAPPSERTAAAGPSVEGGAAGAVKPARAGGQPAVVAP